MKKAASVEAAGGLRCASSLSQTKRTKYQPKSANLELVTIIECVCADGTGLSPGFVFSGKDFSPEWFEVDLNIW